MWVLFGNVCVQTSIKKWSKFFMNYYIKFWILIAKVDNIWWIWVLLTRNVCVQPSTEKVV